MKRLQFQVEPKKSGIKELENFSVMNIRVNIERLLLDGLNIGPAQGGLLTKALEEELTRLLARNGSPSVFESGGSFSDPCSNTVPMRDVNDPVRLGRRIAQEIYGVLGENTWA